MLLLLPGTKTEAYVYAHHFHDCDSQVRQIRRVIDKADNSGSFLKENQKELLCIPAACKVQLVLAFGYAAENVQLEVLGGDGETRDEEGVRHVPKRTLEEVLLRG